MENTTVTDYLRQWNDQQPDRVWLRDRKGDTFVEWTWQKAYAEINAMAAWLEDNLAGHDNNIAILSRNRAHWFLADFAIAASGNVSVPLFTTQKADITRYVLDFTDTKALFLGEADNWEATRAVVPEHVQIITFPDVEEANAAYQWDTAAAECRDRRPAYECKHDDVYSLVFTSGTTGVPKGVMQDHDSMLTPYRRLLPVIPLREFPRFFSYLPLAHLGERHAVGTHSLLRCAEVTFNESLATLLQELPDVKPHFFYGAPRVWEMLHQVVSGTFGGQDGLDKSLAEDREGTIAKVKGILGLEAAEFTAVGAAPMPPVLIHWYESVGITVTEGYGQTECNVSVLSTNEDRRIGSIGKPVPGVEARLSEEGELLVRAGGTSPGYYKMPQETAETFVDGWVHTGDKMRIDEDGFYYITGRVKEYFKTIQGKFVAPSPIEGEFAKCQSVEQQCLLGRGYSKTVMVCVMSSLAQQEAPDKVEADLRTVVDQVNHDVEKHARIGAVIVSKDPWTIENGFMTVTMKMKRNEIEARFGELAERLARDAAEQAVLLVEFV